MVSVCLSAVVVVAVTAILTSIAVRLVNNVSVRTSRAVEETIVDVRLVGNLSAFLEGVVDLLVVVSCSVVRIRLLDGRADAAVLRKHVLPRL